MAVALDVSVEPVLYNVEFAAYYGLYAYLFCIAVELERTVHNAVIRHGECGHPEVFCFVQNVLYACCAVQKTVFSMNM